MGSKTRIVNYLEELAKGDNALASKLEDKSIKTYDKMMAYITEEVRKLCEKGCNSICIEDDTVFKWARHYWLDYEEKAEPKNKLAKVDNSTISEEIEEQETITQPKKAKLVKQVNKSDTIEEISLFDF